MPRRRARSYVPYDPDAEKARRLEPLEGAMTFLALMELYAAVDVAVGRDPYDQWLRAKEIDREQARRERRRKRRTRAADRSTRR